MGSSKDLAERRKGALNPEMLSRLDSGASCLRISRFNPGGDGEEGEMERSIVWLTQVYADLTSVVRCLSERDRLQFRERGSALTQRERY